MGVINDLKLRRRESHIEQLARKHANAVVASFSRRSILTVCNLLTFVLLL